MEEYIARTMPTSGLAEWLAVEEKPWGDVQTLHVDRDLLLQRIRVARGGFCSVHRHEARWNRFAIGTGRLIIEMWAKARRTVAVLSAGGSLDVAPGLWHRFTAVEPVVAFEVYWVGTHIVEGVSPDDIERDVVFSRGGILPPRLVERRRWVDDVC